VKRCLLELLLIVLNVVVFEAAYWHFIIDATS